MHNLVLLYFNKNVTIIEYKSNDNHHEQKWKGEKIPIWVEMYIQF